jgi:cbb3-type cytochrome oxidase subunit 3
MDMMPFIMWLEHNSILLVFTVFLVIVLTTYWPGRKSSIERNGRIPLDDDR